MSTPEKFSSLAEATEAITKLQAEFDAGQELLNGAADREKQLTDDLATVTAERDEAVAQAASAKGEIEQLTEDLEKSEKSTDAKAAKIAAESFTDPVEDEPKGSNDPETMPRAEFEKVPVYDRPAILKSGVQIVD